MATTQAMPTQKSKKMISVGGQSDTPFSAGPSRGCPICVPAALCVVAVMLGIAGAAVSVAFAAQCVAEVTVTRVVGMSSMTTLGVCQTMRRLVKTLLAVV